MICWVSQETAMKCLRIYTTPDGELHFDDVELPTTRSVHPEAMPLEGSASDKASASAAMSRPQSVSRVTLISWEAAGTT